MTLPRGATLVVGPVAIVGSLYWLTMSAPGGLTFASSSAADSGTPPTSPQGHSANDPGTTLESACRERLCRPTQPAARYRLPSDRARRLFWEEISRKDNWIGSIAKSLCRRRGRCRRVTSTRVPVTDHDSPVLIGCRVSTVPHTARWESCNMLQRLLSSRGPSCGAQPVDGQRK